MGASLRLYELGEWASREADGVEGCLMSTRPAPLSLLASVFEPGAPFQAEDQGYTLVPPGDWRPPWMGTGHTPGSSA